MEWHVRNKSEKVVLCIPTDSRAMKHIDEKWPEKFKDEPRSIILGLSINGACNYFFKFIFFLTARYIYGIIIQMLFIIIEVHAQYFII